MHLGYAIQWFVIAIVMLGGGGALLRLRQRGRSRP
jgi:cytochrome oxidase assembly protein ShyY1